MVKIGTTQNQRKLFYQLQKQKNELLAMGETPDYALLSSRMGIPAEEIEEMSQRLSQRDLSLEYSTDDSGKTLLDLQTDEDSADIESEFGKLEEIALLREK